MFPPSHQRSQRVNFADVCESNHTHDRNMRPTVAARVFQRYALSVQYNGKFFCGSSGHPSTMGKHPAKHPSVQEEVEAALHKFARKTNVGDLQFSSRTDRGVHALGNTFHVDIERRSGKDQTLLAPHEPVTVQRALNSMLAPKGLCITSASTVPSTFHARFDAQHRTYMYRLLVLPRASAAWRGCLFEQDKSWIISPKNSHYLNVDLMKAAARPLLGTHNFSSFQNAGCQSRTSVKTLDVLDVRERRWSMQSLPNDLTCPNFTPFDFFQSSTMGLNSYIPGSSGVISAPASLGGGAVGVEEEGGGHVFTNTNSLMTREQEISVQEIIITVRARSFLYNQVRNIVGFLVNQGDRYDARVMKHYDLVGQYVGEVEEVEEGEEGEEETQEDTSSDASVDDILESERAATTLLERMDRDVAPAKAPARGLYLMHVGY